MSSCLRSGCQIQVQRIAMFAGQHSDISHRKSVDISAWPQKEGKTVWILGEQQYFGNVVPFLQGRDSGFV